MGGERCPSAVLAFSRFKVVRYRREFFVDGQLIELGGRAFDTLLALIDAGASVIGKDELMRRIWPDRIVEENNLQAQISALRKVFGADRHLIRTVAGRGYQFTGEIRAAAGPPSPLPASNLPEPVSDLIGRDVSLREVVDLVTTHRLVTLTGTGGIGKTRLGLEPGGPFRPGPDGGGAGAVGAPARSPLRPVTRGPPLRLPP